MKIVRLLVLLAVLAPATALAAERTYSVKFPDGWTADVDKGLVAVTSPANGDTDGAANCNTGSNATPGTASRSQASLNEYAAAPWDAAEWANLMGARADRLQVIETSSRMVGDLRFRTATILFRAGALSGQSNDAKGHIGFYLLPGQVVVVGCYALPAVFDRVKARFETTVNSLRIH